MIILQPPRPVEYRSCQFAKDIFNYHFFFFRIAYRFRNQNWIASFLNKNGDRNYSYTFTRVFINSMKRKWSTLNVLRVDEPIKYLYNYWANPVLKFIYFVSVLEQYIHSVVYSMTLIKFLCSSYTSITISSRSWHTEPWKICLCLPFCLLPIVCWDR